MNPRAARRFVAYYRVSTDRQGRSGLGLEARQKAVDYLNGGAWELVGEFVEVESGKSLIAELARAIGACRKHKARLGSPLIGCREISPSWRPL